MIQNNTFSCYNIFYLLLRFVRLKCDECNTSRICAHDDRRVTMCARREASDTGTQASRAPVVDVPDVHHGDNSLQMHHIPQEYFSPRSGSDHDARDDIHVDHTFIQLHSRNGGAAVKRVRTQQKRRPGDHQEPQLLTNLDMHGETFLHIRRRLYIAKVRACPQRVD